MRIYAMSYLIDSHCHIDFPHFQNRRVEDILQKAHSLGVEKIINVGASLESSRNSVQLAKVYSAIYASVGIHPTDTASLPADYLEQLSYCAAQKKVVALGEIGLDYFRNPDKEKQQAIFKAQLELAIELRLPIILHIREAYSDVLDILKIYQKKYCGIVHCFTEEYGIVEPFLNMGFFVSFNGIITFSNAHLVRETAKKIPLDRIVLETDAPFLAPVPYRGKTNEPAYVKYVAETLSLLKDENFDTIQQATTENVIDLFHLA